MRARGASVGSLRVSFLPAAHEALGLAVVVPKRVGIAVRRNLQRRRVREALRTGVVSLQPGIDLVVRVYAPNSYHRLIRNLSSAVRRLGIARQ